METNVRYTIVGAFVIFLVTAIVLAIIWLSSGITVHQYTNYMVLMDESVSGLSIDSVVEFNGVEVGKVKGIELNSKNPQLVEVLLNIKSATPVTKGTVATLTTRGLTGVAFMSLKDKSTNLKPLVREHGQRYPIIPTAPSFFMRLDTALSKLSTNIESVSKSLQGLLDKSNLESIKSILNNIQEVTDALAKNNEKLNSILLNTESASKQFGPFLKSSTSTMRTIEAQTLPAMTRLLSNLDQVVQTLSEVSAEIKQNPSVLIRGTSPRPPGPGESRR